MTAHEVLNLLNTPVWVVLPEVQEIVFANRAAQEISGNHGVPGMRHGSLSAHAQAQLTAYMPALLANEQVVEIWTVLRAGKPVPLSCRLSLFKSAGKAEAILVEGLLTGGLPTNALVTPPAGSRREAQRSSDEHGFYEKLFEVTTAPMLLIDPSSEGRIVDANLAATQFYGYSRQEFCQKHTWEINAMGREILPIMQEVAKLPGGHKPLNFVHRLADGSLRDVQTYAGPVELDGNCLMLCVIHDITEQRRLENELERAALRDPLTGLWNRRQFLLLLENARLEKQRHGFDYSLMLLDADHFKTINDRYGHDAGDEVLVWLARTFEARTRKTDAVCRWGGEEFMVLLPYTNLESAAHLAECLRECIAELQHPQLPSITVSIGVAQHQADEPTQNWIKRADGALYRAKAMGRNRVIAT